MRLENESVDELKKEVLRIVGEHLDLSKYKVFFFGSRVTGKGDERSDIDIGIEGEKTVPVEIMTEIESEIKAMAILYKVEIVDFKTVSEDFYEVAKQNIEFIN
jgi:predicted nucleotidyltransferase